jgi:biopolymer transport protein ExbB/TolQ
MSAESVLGALGLREFLAEDFLAVQLVVMAGTAAFFVFSMAMMIMAARSAGSARRARKDAEAQFRKAQDVLVEARQISAQIERAAGRRMAADAHAPIRVGAKDTTPEAEVEIIAENLDAATEAATVPKSLLRRSPRRR